MTGLPVWETVAATGHRPQHLTTSERAWVRVELSRITAKLRDEYGMKTGCSGFALGTDLWWADDLVKADVDLWAHIPFPQQPDVWPSAADRAEWLRLRELAIQPVTFYGDLDGLSGDARLAEAIRLLHARNDGMLRPADAVVAVHKRSKSRGGTASAVRKAKGLHRPIVLLDPERKTVTLSNLPAPAGAGHSPDA